MLQATLKSPYVPRDLRDGTRVFVRQVQKKPLHLHHIGPFPVVERKSDTFVLRVNGKNDIVALERLKPTHIEQVHMQGWCYLTSTRRLSESNFAGTRMFVHLERLSYILSKGEGAYL